MNELLMIAMGSLLSLGSAATTFMYGYPMLKSNADSSKFLPHMIHKVLGGRKNRLLKAKIRTAFNAYRNNHGLVSEIDFNSLYQLAAAVGSAYVFTEDIASSLKTAIRHERKYSDKPSDFFMWEIFKVIRSINTLDQAEPSLQRGTYTRAEWKHEISRLTQSTRQFADSRNWMNDTFERSLAQRKKPVERLKKRIGG